MAGSNRSLLHTQGVLSQSGVPCMNCLYVVTTFPLTYIIHWGTFNIREMGLSFLYGEKTS